MAYASEKLALLLPDEHSTFWYNEFKTLIMQLDQELAGRIIQADLLEAYVVEGLDLIYTEGQTTVTLDVGTAYSSLGRVPLAAQKAFTLSNTGSPHTEYLSVVGREFILSTSARQAGDLALWDIGVNASGQVTATVTDVRSFAVKLKVLTETVVVINEFDVRIPGKLMVGSENAPTTRVHVIGDVYAETGLVYKAPNTTRFLETVDNSGNRVITPL